MPQVKRGARGAGLHVPGAYQALFDLESDRWERSERAAARMKAETGTFMRRNTGRLLKSLESGEAVVVDRVQVEAALSERDRPPVRLPLARAVRTVRLTPDDRVIPAVSGKEAD
jgi:hypothetical protein